MYDQELWRWVLLFGRSSRKRTTMLGGRQRGRVYHVYGDATNQDTLLCCRVWSEPRAVRRPGPRLRPHTSWFASWSPAHRSRSTDSMTTTPPTAHALQTPTDTRTNTTRGWGMRGKRKGEGRSIPMQAVREWERHEIFNESEHIPWWQYMRRATFWPPPKNIPAKGKRKWEMKLYLHLAMWKKMEVRRWHLKSCCLSNDEEMDLASLLLELLELSITPQRTPKDPETPATSNTLRH